MKSMKKTIAALVAISLVFGCVIGGSLAWLMAESTEVTNVFTTSDVDVSLEENKTDFQMIPGYTIDKDPTVKVKSGSEDCWLFVEVIESITPDLDSYIAYNVNTTTGNWEVVSPTATKTINGAEKEVTVYGRKVKDITENTSFSILAAGQYPATGTAEYTWAENEVLVLPTVTKAMMKSLNVADAAQPTLTFKAYVHQLWKTNEPASNATETEIAAAQFTAAEAWQNASTATYVSGANTDNGTATN